VTLCLRVRTPQGTFAHNSRPTESENASSTAPTTSLRTASTPSCLSYLHPRNSLSPPSPWRFESSQEASFQRYANSDLFAIVACQGFDRCPSTACLSAVLCRNVRIGPQGGVLCHHTIGPHHEIRVQRPADRRTRITRKESATKLTRAGKMNNHWKNTEPRAIAHSRMKTSQSKATETNSSRHSMPLLIGVEHVGRGQAAQHTGGKTRTNKKGRV